MPIAMLMEIPGGTQKMYDDMMGALTSEGVPEGGIVHLAAPMEGGWRVVDVWESQEHFERFFRDHLAAAMQKAGIPPETSPKFAELYSVLSVDYGLATSPAG